ncbi:MAG: hypothetical protein O7B26_07340, partial [Planctomycetota bacterium]|nr:hypothetical protein [Planctomycetota bacterium]
MVASNPTPGGPSATAASTVRIALRVKPHSNPITELQESMLLQLVPGLLVIGIVWAFLGVLSWPQLFVLWGIAFLIVVVAIASDWFGEFREYWSRYRVWKALICSVRDLAVYAAFAPLFLFFKGIAHGSRRLRDRANREHPIEDSSFESRITCYGEPIELARTAA